MIDKSDRELAERLAWWLFADMTSLELRVNDGVEWWLSFEDPPQAPIDVEADELLIRVWRRMHEYEAGADYRPCKADYAERIGLDLGGVFESTPNLAMMLVDRAIEHCR